MQTQSPQFKLNQMTPLSVHQKYLVEDEPSEELLESDYKKIKFNETMIVCNYKPWQNIIQFRKTIEKLKEYNNIDWINPNLNLSQKSKQRPQSILKKQIIFQS